MPKKRSSEVSTAPKEESNVGEKKPLPKSKKVDEIDDIFSSKKRKKPEKEKVGGAEEKKDKSKKTKKKKSKGPMESEFARSSKPRSRTNDGLAIYSAEELGINNQNAGGTPRCPFDCSCCF